MQNPRRCSQISVLSLLRYRATWLPSIKVRTPNQVKRRNSGCGAQATQRNWMATNGESNLGSRSTFLATEKTTGANMDLKFSKVTRKGPITIVTLSRPEVYNALHTDAHFELNRVFDDFSADPGKWVAIVTGAGDKAFCAGNDLKWQAAGGKRGWDTGGFAGLTARFDCDKPIIAAVNGVAMGGGFEDGLAIHFYLGC